MARISSLFLVRGSSGWWAMVCRGARERQYMIGEHRAVSLCEVMMRLTLECQFRPRVRAAGDALWFRVARVVP